MCFGSGGFRAFPNPGGLGIEDNPSLRLQPSVSAPVSDAGVLALPQAKPPIPPVPGPPRVGPIGPGGRGGGGGPRNPMSELYGVRMFQL